MAEIVNPRRHRKQARRSVAEEAAAENRARFGRTKAERALQDLEAQSSDRLLDAHRRELSPTDKPR